ncbi:hypothetical protein HNQ94_002320 [Salirhabdus euzebyi]|uniref:Lipocalin-like domain-containing protein n=1 Tax=Salirhabdus euzebyi TaxID=394506 RepID=A0A841Q5X0_9BACI|nr:hypothetical protein [Salirhabdus euzebyi]MBB6453869.1 hypothetical protein [Salirhabdus euzebyi]
MSKQKQRKPFFFISLFFIVVALGACSNDSSLKGEWTVINVEDNMEELSSQNDSSETNKLNEVTTAINLKLIFTNGATYDFEGDEIKTEAFTLGYEVPEDGVIEVITPESNQTIPLTYELEGNKLILKSSLLEITLEK